MTSSIRTEQDPRVVDALVKIHEFQEYQLFDGERDRLDEIRAILERTEA